MATSPRTILHHFAVDLCNKRHRSSLPAPSSTLDPDLWFVVMTFLDARSLLRLALVNRTFHRMVMEEHVWKRLCIQELHASPARDPQFSWRRLYASAADGSHAYSLHDSDRHIDWIRIGCFHIQSGNVIVTDKLSEFASSHENKRSKRQCESVELCNISNVLMGTWIADLHLVQCPVCNTPECEGTMQTLDARHWELLLHKEHQKGEWTFEEAEVHVASQCDVAAAGIFDAQFLNNETTRKLLDLKSWIAAPTDMQPRIQNSFYAAAVSTNLETIEGLQVKIYTMRGGEDGPVVSIRVSHQLV